MRKLTVMTHLFITSGVNSICPSSERVFRRVLIVSSLSTSKLAAARAELELLSLYGWRQPMSREHRLGLRRKIKSLIIQHGALAIWFTLSPNDITSPIKLRLAAYRTREAEEAEAFLVSLDASYK